VLTSSETVAAFIQPIIDQDLATLRSLQKFLLKVSVTTVNDSLAGTRLLSLLTDTDLFALLLDSTYPVTLKDLTGPQLSQIVSLQILLQQVAPLSDTFRIALNETKKYLPKFTTDFINEYNTIESPLEQVTTTVFMILTANLQE
jgi:hypothetical protein